MKTIETIVYNFDELNDKAKERAREWYKRASEDDTFWHECTIEDCTIIANLLGIDVEHIYFRGFWSQGDGACFVGKFRASDVKVGKVKEHAPLDESLHKIAEEFEKLAKENTTLYFKTTHRGHYYHYNSVDFDFEYLDNEGNELPYNKELEEGTKDLAKCFMEWIYKKLEKAYEYENSDENVDENIRANEYTFTAEGERFG